MTKVLRKLFEKHLTWGAAALCLWCVLCQPAGLWAASPPVGAFITNQASAQYADANGNPFPTVTASVQTEVSGAPVLRISKMESNDPVAMGAVLTYHITYENTGNTPASGVVIQDQLSRHVSFQSASDGGVHNPVPAGTGGTVTWNIGDLPANAGGVLSLVVLVKTPADYPPGDPDAIGSGTLISNTASIGSDQGTGDRTIVTTVGQAPNLLIQKVADSKIVPPGGTITYTIAYQNHGNDPATDVQVRDELPAGTALVAGSITAGGRLENRSVIWDLGMLQPGDQGQLSFQARVSQLAIDGGFIRNIAAITSFEQGPIPSGEVLIEVSSKASLALTKTADKQNVLAGEEITYTLRIKNGGNVPLDPVLLNDPLPPGTSFVSADHGGALNAGVTEWDIGRLEAGQETQLALTVRTDLLAQGQQNVSNTAEATAQGLAPVSDTALVAVTCRSQGVPSFLDAAGNAATYYAVGDQACIQVQDADRNTDPAAAQQVTVEVASAQTGDLENLVLTEVDPNSGNAATDTGVFRACIPTDGTAAVAQQNGTLSVVQDSAITVIYTDPLDPSCGFPASVSASAMVDPIAKVFDSVTGAPIQGAVVTLYTSTGARANTLPGWPLGLADSVTTGADGAFSFPQVPAGSFYFLVEPGPDHSFPSSLTNQQLPAGFNVDQGSRGEAFVLIAAFSPLDLDIPVDPKPGVLSITKTANKTLASIGDMVVYEITVTNEGDSPVSDVTVHDKLPHGVGYREGTSSLNGSTIQDPSNAGTRQIAWSLGNLGAGETAKLIYRTVPGPNSHRGDGKNTAQATGTSLGKGVTSNIATHKVRITEGVFTSNGTIIGKVFLDKEPDGVQEPVLRAKADCEGYTPCPFLDMEPGIPGVVIYMEDGTRVETDAEGKYSIIGVKPGTHVLRLDETTLPPQYEPVPISNRFMGSDTSQFVDMQPGGLFKANFGVRKTDKPAAQVQTAVPETAKEPVLSEKDAPESLEELSETLRPELKILRPADGAIIAHDSTRVLVQMPLGADLTLWINGKEVSSDRIGKKVTNHKARVVLVEFIGLGVETGQENHIKAQVKDPFGNIRGNQEIVVQTAGRPETISIQSDMETIPADGKTTASFTVSMTDGNGLAVTQPSMVTLSAPDLEIMGKDADPGSEGWQVPYRDGRAVFSVKAPVKAGIAEIIALCEGLRAERQVHFAPHLRDMIITGFGEVVIGHGDTRGDTRYLEKDSSLDEGTYVDGKGAVFLKGKVPGDALLTVAFDSAKDRDDDQHNALRAQENDLDSEDKYPIYGDESKTTYEAESRDKLYAKLEKDKSYILYGDYETGLDKTRLAPFTRTFTGLKGLLETKYFELKAFGAETEQVQVVDTMRGRGVSGYYYLNNGGIIEGSERVVIETRDRFQVTRVISRELKTRGVDYEVNYELGALLFKEPVPSFDESFNPIFIVVIYETDNSDQKNYVYGARGAVRPFSWLELGATNVIEENEAGDNRILGTDVTIKLPGNTTFTAEYAQTEALVDQDYVLTPHTGDGYSLRLESRPLPNLDLSAYYSNISDYFYNLSAIDSPRGTERYGFQAQYKLTENTALNGHYYDEKDELGETENRRASLGMSHKIEKLTLEGDVLYEDSTSGLVPQSNPNFRYPLDYYQEPMSEVTSGRLGAQYEMTKKLSLTASHKQGLSDSEYRMTDAGVSYQVTDITRAYVKEEYATYPGSEDTRTVVGAESEVAKDTVAYNEYRLVNGADGRRDWNVIGLRNKYRLSESVTGSFSLEYLATVSGDRKKGQSDGFAASTGLAYIPSDRFKLTTRLEFSNEEADDTRRSYLGELGLAYAVNPDYTLLFRARGFKDDQESSGERTYSRTMLGVAYRPVDFDRFNALAKMEYKHENDSIIDPEYRADSYIPSIEGIYQWNRKTQMALKYAGKLFREDGWQSYTDLVQGRITYDITERFDTTVAYRVLTSHDINTRYQGGYAEVGYRVIEDLWLSAGYCFDDFDTDLTGDSFRGQGPYLKLRFKFDEDTFRRKRKR